MIEVLIGILLLSIVLSSLFISIRGAAKSGADSEEKSMFTFYSAGKMEEIIAMDFADIPLSSPSGSPLPSPYSDTVTVRGKVVNRNVYVDLYDGDGDAVPDSGLKKITVSTGDVSLNTLKADYPYATIP